MTLVHMSTSSLWPMLNFLDSPRYSQVYNPYNNVPIGCFACCMTYNTQLVKTYTEYARYNSTYDFWYIPRSCASRLFYCYASSSSSQFWNRGFGILVVHQLCIGRVSQLVIVLRATTRCMHGSFEDSASLAGSTSSLDWYWLPLCYPLEAQNQGYITS